MTPLDSIHNHEFWTSVVAGLFLIVMAPVLAYDKYRKSGDHSRRAKAMWLLFGMALASLGSGLLIDGATGVWLLSLSPPSPITPETIAARLRPAEWASVADKVAMAFVALGFVGSGALWLVGKRGSRSM